MKDLVYKFTASEIKYKIAGNPHKVKRNVFCNIHWKIIHSSPIWLITEDSKRDDEYKYSFVSKSKGTKLHSSNLTELLNQISEARLNAKSFYIKDIILWEL